MDIIILALLLTTVVLVVRGASRRWVLVTWVLALVLMLGCSATTSPLRWI